MKQIQDYIKEWSNLSYSRNPYDNQIPKSILESEKLLRKYDRFGKPIPFKNLSELKQNGWSLSYIAEGNMNMLWEKWETISFLPIFHHLVETNSLCPANYVVHIIRTLNHYKSQDEEKNKIIHSMDFYVGTIARGLRAFASYLREYSLTEIINQTLIESSNLQSKEYKLYSPSIRQDMKFKTDLMFQYDKKIYRVWSYQSTLRGIERTSNRVLQANGKGYNILIPFDMKNKKSIDGWFLYQQDMVQNIIKKYVLEPQEKILLHQDYCKQVKENPSIINNSIMFLVS